MNKFKYLFFILLVISISLTSCSTDITTLPENSDEKEFIEEVTSKILLQTMMPTGARYIPESKIPDLFNHNYTDEYTNAFTITVNGEVYTAEVVGTYHYTLEESSKKIRVSSTITTYLDKSYRGFKTFTSTVIFTLDYSNTNNINASLYYWTTLNGKLYRLFNSQEFNLNNLVFLYDKIEKLFE